jgi:hypothetical protein
MTASPIDAYRRQIERELQASNATEGTHRPALKTLLETLYPGVTATNEPKRVACGAPDFSLTRKKVPLGHIETKARSAGFAFQPCGFSSGAGIFRAAEGAPRWKSRNARRRALRYRCRRDKPMTPSSLRSDFHPLR